MRVLLQLKQVRRRLDDDPREAEALPGNVVVLERFQLPAGAGLRAGQYLADGIVDLPEVRRANGAIPLENRDTCGLCVPPSGNPFGKAVRS